MMRSEILALLRTAAESGDGYLSGEEIAKKLLVSRTAVWKHINELKIAGYEINSHSRRGYALVEAPDLLLPNEIKNYLHTKLLGHNIKYYQEVISTNNQAKILAAEGAVDGTIVISEQQNGGRGRLSRGWFSPRSQGIWLSIILRPNFLPQEAPKCTLLSAVALVKAIERVAKIKVGIKWPNDILYSGKKLAGILTEMNAEMDAINYIVIGMGVNVNIQDADIPDELRDIMTSLCLLKGDKIDRVLLLCAILEELEALYQIALKEGFGTILREWKKYSVTLGQEVRVMGFNNIFTGTAIDIDEAGALLVKLDDGSVKTVLAGDVSIRPKK